MEARGTSGPFILYPKPENEVRETFCMFGLNLKLSNFQ